MRARQFRRKAIAAACLLAATACALFLLPNPRRYRALLVARLFRTNNPPIVVPLPKDFRPHVPPGFAASILARGFDEPRWLAVAQNGDLFVADSTAGEVIVLHFSASNDRIESREVFADHLFLPFGIAFHEGFVYVALTNKVVRFPYDRDTSRRLGEAGTILDLPGLGYNQHWTRSLAFSPDGHELFVSVGSRTNNPIHVAPQF
jgi:glucose/arabinose dehydrogenase